MRRAMIGFLLAMFTFSAYSQDNSDEPDSVFQNSVYLGSNLLTISITYDHCLVRGHQGSFLFGGGVRQIVAFGEGTIPFLKLAYLTGKEKHFLESGANFIVMEEFLPLVPVIAYRRQAKSGFLFRVELGLYAERDTFLEPGDAKWDFFPMPELSLGYSF